MKRPSYFPKKIDSKIPKSLERENNFWQMDNELILSDQSANALIYSNKVARDLFETDLLESNGLNPKLKGFFSLKGHAIRVAIFSLLIRDKLAQEGSLMTIDTRTLATAALLHDIGKLDPEIHNVIMFPGKIKKDDKKAWEIIRKHPLIGEKIALLLPGIFEKERKKIANIILNHHERPDGNGYYKKQKEEIPDESLIISTADTLDAILSNRPENKKMPIDQATQRATQILIACKGSQLETLPVESIMELLPESGIFYKRIEEAA